MEENEIIQALNSYVYHKTFPLIKFKKHKMAHLEIF